MNVSVNQIITITQSISTVGFKENKNESDFIIYPNPAKEKIVLKLNGSKFNKGEIITFTDITGKKVLEHTLTENTEELTLNTKTLNPGNYFINFRSDLKTITKKLLIH
ncbi:MAG: T9SS type A sorting domain-containing protein [Bacteroidetes bacterium]|nr:T9SS type A sorting domain-containing protein [Bacteroidota bacterium]